jgi:hypothetical protein
VQGDGLPRPHLLELGFLEISRYPDVIDRHDCQQRLPRLDALTQLYGLASNDAAHRGIDFRVARIERGCVNVPSLLRRSKADFMMARLDKNHAALRVVQGHLEQVLDGLAAR